MRSTLRTIRNVSWSANHTRMISEGSCDRHWRLE